MADAILRRPKVQTYLKPTGWKQHTRGSIILRARLQEVWLSPVARGRSAQRCRWGGKQGTAELAPGQRRFQGWAGGLLCDFLWSLAIRRGSIWSFRRHCQWQKLVSPAIVWHFWVVSKCRHFVFNTRFLNES